MAIYMKYGHIDGGVYTKGYEKWIELRSFHMGVARTIGTAARGLESREASEPQITEITVTKLLDRASPDLYMEAVAGDLSATVKFSFTTTSHGKDGGGVRPYLEYEFHNCGLSGYALSSGEEGHPTETLSMNFTRIRKKYIPLDAKLGGSPRSVGYDLDRMSKS